MTQYLIIREVAEGAARLIGVTEETGKTPQEVVDWWAQNRAGRAGSDPVSRAHVYVADMENVSVFDLNPQPPVTPVEVVPVDIAEAFSSTNLINVDA